MGLMQAVANYIIRKAEAPVPYIDKWQFGRPYYPDTDYRALVDKYAGWVYACAHINAINCAQIPLRLYVAKLARKSKALFPTISIPTKRMDYISKSPSVHRYLAKAMDVEEVTEHLFLDLMQKVNPEMNEFDLKESAFLFQDLTGNAYWVVLKNNYGIPDQIWPLMPQYVKIVPDKQKFIGHYEYSISLTDKHVIESTDMVHFKYVNPKDTYYGIGPLQACVVAADLSASMNIYEASLMANRAQPDMALIYPAEAGMPSEDEQKRLAELWKKRFGGIKKAGKLAVLTGGAELKPLSLTPKEMAFLQGRKATMNEIAAIFGVPVSKLTAENVNRANAEAGEYSYMKDTILPRLRKFEQKLNEKLLPMFDERLFCSFDNPVPEDRDFRLKEIESHLKSGYASINQELQIDGRDTVIWGEMPIMPMTMIPLGNAPPPLPTGKTKEIKAPRTLPPLNHPTNYVNESFVRAVQRYFRKQADEILTAFDKDSDTLDKSIQKDRAGDYISGWFDMQKWNGHLSETTEPFLRYTLMSGGERALKNITAERQFDPLSPKVLGGLEKHRIGSVMSINGTKVKQLRGALAEGMDLGEPVSQLRKRVEHVYENATAYEAERIARTETIWAWNEGAMQGYIQSGLVEKKQWVSSGDDRSCDACLEMDGRIVGIEDSYFEKGGEFGGLHFDYEDVGHPPLHCSCRCCIVPIVEGI